MSRERSLRRVFVPGAFGSWEKRAPGRRELLGEESSWEERAPGRRFLGEGSQEYDPRTNPFPGPFSSQEKIPGIMDSPRSGIPGTKLVLGT